MRITRITLIIVPVFVAYIYAHGSAYAQSPGWPKTEEFMSALSVCALDLRIDLDGKIEGSIKSFYEGTKTTGKITNSTTSKFIDLFPASDRISAYKIYTECVLKIIEAPRAERRSNIEKPVTIRASIMPAVKGSVSGPIAFQISGAHVFNVGYKSVGHYEVINRCKSGRMNISKFRRFSVGPYRYDESEGILYVFENNIWNGVHEWLSRIDLIKNGDCINELWFHVAFKVYFDTDTSDKNYRYFMSKFSISLEKFYPNIFQSTLDAFKFEEDIDGDKNTDGLFLSSSISDYYSHDLNALRNAGR
ncbi:Hypothetical protein NGAL_HAMBI2610_25830 [Neorhizobium galegae bv. orientalis]|nr:Hypothetical protein NGAL_HAMBI2610_25830 [Neorhizobium galegae bv. orientalis]